MIFVVVDTNIVVSANLKANSLPGLILDLAAHGKIIMFVSAEILAEYELVLRRPKLRLDPDLIERTLAVVRKTSTLMTPTKRLSVCSDEPDNRFLECAAAAGAHYVITGNTKHFPSRYKSTKVVTPREFISLLGDVLTEGSRGK